MIGKNIAQYEILSLLGQGGMGEVYLAEDTRLGRKVALKFLAPELARDHESVVRFKNEAKAAAELSHPNIATIYDIGEHEGKPFLVLEFLQGQTLRERIELGPLPIEDVLRIGQALAEGLVEAHSHGVIHRDIKSANIMLTDKGEVKILDFGLARRGEATQLTQPGTTLGTVPYMSPEQARGQTADERSDLWSLGVVLYECLTGRLPFVGDNAAVIEQIKTDEVTPPTGLRTGIPMELEHAVLRCLEKDAQLRYQHADDLVASLTRIATHLASGSEPTRVVASGSAIGKRRSRVGIIVGLVLVMVSAGIVWWQTRTGQEASSVLPEDQSVAVVDFRNLVDADDHTTSEMMTGLVTVGLIESGVCRVISAAYLHDLRRRLFGSERGAIQQEEALELARKANATLLVVGEMAERAAGTYITWRVVDAASGRALGARRVQGEDIFSLADSAIVGMMPLLARSCEVEVPTASRSVTEITTSSPEAYRSFAEGLLARDEFRWEDAVLHFEQAVEADSTFAMAHYRLARALRRFDLSRSQSAFAKAWELRSHVGMKDRMLLDAERASIRGRRGEVIAISEEMLSRWPDDRDVLQIAATIESQTGYSDEARVLYGRAMELYPDDRGLANFQVYVLLTLQKTDEALALAQQLTQKFPENSNSWDTLGDVCVAAAEYDSAVAASRKALAIRPSYWRARWRIADCAYYQGDTRSAIRLILELLETPELNQFQRWWCLQRLGFFYAELGRYKDAYDPKAEWASQGDELRDIAPSLVWIIWSENAFLSSYYSRIPAPEALANLEYVHASLDSLGGHGPHSNLRRSLNWFRGRALVGVDSLDAAKLILEDLERVNQSKGPYYWLQEPAFDLRGRIALAEDRPEDALAAAEGWMAVKSWRADGLLLCDLLVTSYRSLERWDDAAAVLTDQLRTTGGWALGHYELGQVYEQLHRLDEAEAEYALFLEMWAGADRDLPELLDARHRVSELRSRR